MDDSRGRRRERPLLLATPPPKTRTDYASAKRGGELAVLETFGKEALVARAGLILGPYEKVGRLPWWLRRLQRGGRSLRLAQRIDRCNTSTVAIWPRGFSTRANIASDLSRREKATFSPQSLDHFPLHEGHVGAANIIEPFGDHHLAIG
jgi:hypothetical protein